MRLKLAAGPWIPHLALGAVSIVLALCIVRVWRNGGYAAVESLSQPALDQPISYAQWKRMVARDPRVGSAAYASSLLQICRQDPYVRPGRPFAIMFIAGCTHCVERYLNEFDHLQRTHPAVQFVVVPRTVDGDMISAYSSAENPEFRFETTNTGPLIASANAYFTPRLYFFDSASTLRYVQPPAASMKDALSAIRHLAAGRPLTLDDKGNRR